jgi:hypothetical protein
MQEEEVQSEPVVANTISVEQTASNNWFANKGAMQA